MIPLRRLQVNLWDPPYTHIPFDRYERLYGTTATEWIAPIFARENFRVEYHRAALMNTVQQWNDPEAIISQDMYRHMKPALGLASILLAWSETFYMRILFADHLRQPSGLAEFYLDDNYKPDALDIDLYQNIMADIPNRTHIFTGPIPAGQRDGYHILTISGYHRMGNTPGLFWQLSPSYVNYYNVSPAVFAGRRVSNKRSVAFHFASSLCHEFAHCMHMIRMQDGYVRCRTGNPHTLQRTSMTVEEDEPMYTNTRQLINELGREWELFAYKGTPEFLPMQGSTSWDSLIDPNTGVPDWSRSDGLCLRHWDDNGPLAQYYLDPQIAQDAFHLRVLWRAGHLRWERHRIDHPSRVPIPSRLDLMDLLQKARDEQNPASYLYSQQHDAVLASMMRDELCEAVHALTDRRAAKCLVANHFPLHSVHLNPT